MTSGGPSPEPAGRVLYGRRKGRRLRPAQRRALEEVVPRIRIPSLPEDRPVDPCGLFDRPVREVWMEIGFGAGEHLLAQAAANPDVGLIGCDPYLAGAARLARGLTEDAAGRVRVWQDDARILIGRLPEASLSRVFILFPDPWPKARHHKRRMVSPPVLAGLARIMRGGAELRVATDDPGYLLWSLDCLQRAEDFVWTARAPSDWRAPPQDWPETRYARKARAAGRRSVYLRYLRAVPAGAPPVGIERAE